MWFDILVSVICIMSLITNIYVFIRNRPPKIENSVVPLMYKLRDKLKGLKWIRGLRVIKKHLNLRFYYKGNNYKLSFGRHANRKCLYIGMCKNKSCWKEFYESDFPSLYEMYEQIFYLILNQRESK